MRNFALLLVIALLVTSCFVPVQNTASKEDQKEPEKLTISICSGLESYSQVQALKDSGFVDSLGKSFGTEIEVVFLDSSASVTEIATEGFQGLLITEDPEFTIRLSTRKMVTKLNQTVSDKNLGSNEGLQYGYVFSTNSTKVPVLLVDVDAMENAGLKNIPYTFDALVQALEKLSRAYQVPLGVCGNPNEAGYAVIQQLFGICPSGGREFKKDANGNIVYDKLSGKAVEYLQALRFLHDKALVPQDMLILNEYSLMKMITNKVCPCAVFTDMKYVEEVMKQAATTEQNLALVQLPVPEENLEYGLSSQLMGFVSSSFANTDLACEIFRRIDGYSGTDLTDISETMDKYDLFNLSTKEEYESLNEIAFYAMVLYYKTELESKNITPSYCKIATGYDDLSSFETMKEQWINSEVSTDYEYIDGKALLSILGLVGERK